MKNRRTLSVLSVLLLAFAIPGAALGIEPSAKRFQNCTLLRYQYPGGVAMPGAVNSGGSISNTPKYSKKLYRANKHLDRDKDRIACEN
jgi:hypothetical protein